MGNQSEENLSKLSLAFDRANTSITRTGQAFGELAKSSQEWNIISRVLSGTGAWRLQNQIRAIGNVINVYHTRQEEARKATLEAVDANEKLMKSFEDIEEALSLTNEQIKKTPLFKLFDKAGLNGIMEYKKLWGEAKIAVGEAIDSIGESMAKSSIQEYMSGDIGFMDFMRKQADKSIAVRGARKIGSTAMRIGSGIRNIGMSGIDPRTGFKFTRRNRRDYAGRARTAGANFLKMMESIAGKVKTFFVVGAVVLGKILLGIMAVVTGIALLVFFIKKMNLVKRFKAFEEKFGLFGKIFANVQEYLEGLFLMFKGAFGGDEGKLYKGFKMMLNGLVGIILRVLQTMLSLLIKGIFTAIGGIVKTLGGYLPSWLGGNLIKGFGSNIQGAGAYIGGSIASFANGGVSMGGMALVGERGPELVRLPKGARVHSNAESRRMGGGTINVHVNGRVGASDAEIRDIASKVAREINTQMNRQAHTVGRF